MRFVAILIASIGLAGCAGAVGGTTCTNLISGAGGLLQFCQTNQKIEITESALTDRDAPAKIVNDPSTLSALADHLKLHASMKRSRKLIARACVVGGADYVSVKAADLDRILRDRVVDRSARAF